jgi:alanine-synthesizing transaminase
VYDLTEANPTGAGITLPEADILKALSNPNALAYHPHPLGLQTAREAIAAHYNALGKDIKPEQIIVTTGSSESVGFLLKLLCDPGDSIAVPAPGYPLFDFLATLEGVELFRYRLRRPVQTDDPYGYADWFLNFTELDAALPDRTKVLFCVAPNNPTGTVPTETEWQLLQSFAADRNLALVVDEVFRPYRLDGQPGKPLKADRVPLFTLNGFSKLLGLPQLKLAWMLVEGPGPWLEETLARLEIISDTYLSVATPIQTAVPCLLKMETSLQNCIQQRISENLEFAIKLLAPTAHLQPLKPRAGWYLPLIFNKLSDDEAFAYYLLQATGVLIHPGHLFDFSRPNHAVICLLQQPGIFQEGIRLLCSWDS